MRIVIIGAGECGARAAMALREAGHAGPVTLIGAEGRAPYERPPLSKAVLTGETEPPVVLSLERADALGIDLVDGPVVALDRIARQVLLAGGRVLPYERLLIATGARARPLTLPGAQYALTLRSAADAAAIRARLQPGARVVLIGGGFIGLEVAASAATRGCRVTVLETLPRILARGVPAEIAAVVGRRHAADGVEIRTSIAVQSIGPGTVWTSRGPIAADLVIAGIGAQPEYGLAQASGLVIENGIAVDESFRSSDPAIFAAGDCCSFPYQARRVRLESWRAAQDQAEHVAAAMLGAEAPFRRVPWFWSDQFDLTLQVAGLYDAALPAIRRETGPGAFILFQLGPDGRLVSAAGIGPGQAVAKDIRLAELLIERGARLDAAALATEPNLKKLMRAA
ncbi:MAG TPA: FAD-dependent oxidoreductase [Paracoccaceae bacterium]|nr:FAD-dependent oxidoreductase [Paracoccaceae bacterium]